MDVSVVIPTHNQHARLALVLAGLARQTLPHDAFEVLVIDDGCTDGTADVVSGYERGGQLPVRLLGGARCGRNAARNLGLEAARGALTVFLDADALPAPDLLQRYVEAARTHTGTALFSGLQYHIPDLEYLADPRTGEIMVDVDVPSVVADYLVKRREALILTEAQVRDDFDRVRSRARVGSYPNEGTVRRQDEARALLRARPRSTAGWLAFIPHNGAGATSLLRAAGGFDTEIPFSEGWELAYRVQRQHGGCVVPVEAATYHLYHHHGVNDAAQTRSRYDAIEHMAVKHRDPRIRLVYFWYAHLWRDPFIPEAAVVDDLFEFERLYQELPDAAWHQYEVVLLQHPNQLPVREIEVNYGTCA